jgi:hypothetical protein
MQFPGIAHPYSRLGLSAHACAETQSNHRRTLQNPFNWAFLATVSQIKLTKSGHTPGAGNGRSSQAISSSATTTQSSDTCSDHNYKKPSGTQTRRGLALRKPLIWASNPP